MWERLTHHWVRAGVAVLVAAIALFGLGVAAYAIHVCASATALIDSASEIRTTADAEREFAKWRKRLGKEPWMESDDSGRGGNYCARIVNRAIARLHIVEPSEVTVRVTVRDGELLCVTVDISTPVAPVVIQEWFKPGMQNRFTLSYIKGAVPRAVVQCPSTQRHKTQHSRSIFAKVTLMVSRSGWWRIKAMTWNSISKFLLVAVSLLVFSLPSGGNDDSPSDVKAELDRQKLSLRVTVHSRS